MNSALFQPVTTEFALDDRGKFQFDLELILTGSLGPLFGDSEVLQTKYPVQTNRRKTGVLTQARQKTIRDFSCINKKSDSRNTQLLGNRDPFNFLLLYFELWRCVSSSHAHLGRAVACLLERSRPCSSNRVARTRHTRHRTAATRSPHTAPRKQEARARAESGRAPWHATRRTSKIVPKF